MHCMHTRSDQHTSTYWPLQVVVEMFLGLRLGAHFPTARIPYTDELPLEGESDDDDPESDDALLPPAARQACSHPCCRPLSCVGPRLFHQQTE